MKEYGIFTEESADYSAEEALEAQFYSSEQAERILAEHYADDHAYVHVVEVEEDEE